MRVEKLDYMIGLSLILFVITNFFAYLSWIILSDEVQRLLSLDGFGSHFEAIGLLLWAVLFVLNMFAYFGLFFRKRWGGILFVFLHFLVFFLSFFGGVRVFHGIEYGLTHITLLLDGVIVAVFFRAQDKLAR